MATSTHAAPALPGPLQRSQGIAIRRGIVLVLMTLVVPGSAQVAAGDKRIGRIALRVWLTLLALLVVVGLLAVFARPFLISLYANPITLRVLQVGVLVLGVAWAALMVDAWRIANPRAMSGPGRVVSGVLALALALGAGTAAWAASGMFGAQSSLVTNVFTGGGEAEATHGRYNILLMGGDAGADRWGMRPDTMIVASIDAETGRTVLFSLPRNLQWAPFPQDNPLHAKYPKGFWCKSQECLLNAVYTLAMDNKDLFPDVKYPGAEATADVVGEILGLDINYWAMVDLKGFESLINAVGGIRLDINKRIPIGSKSGPKGVYGYIEPGKNVKLDGFHALWFARSREGSNDYERMARQKCVINAMVQQLNPTTVLTKFNDIAAASEKVVATNIPSDQLGTAVDLALKGRSLPMSSVNFTPPLIKPVKPNFTKIREIVADKIAASEAKDRPEQASPAAEPSQQPSDQPTTSESPASPSPTKSSSGSSTQTEDLDEVCAVSD
ncbi:MAG: LCP family protein [Propionicimonas sp.]|nr:LCP family protein [Propionicimonas sp.]